MTYSALRGSALRTSVRRAAPIPRAFQPIKQNFAPALSARFASTDAGRDGKIHQVIGAVVDGTSKSPLHQRQGGHEPGWELHHITTC